MIGYQNIRPTQLASTASTQPEAEHDKCSPSVSEKMFTHPQPLDWRTNCGLFRLKLCTTAQPSRTVTTECISTGKLWVGCEGWTLRINWHLHVFVSASCSTRTDPVRSGSSRLSSGKFWHFHWQWHETSWQEAPALGIAATDNCRTNTAGQCSYPQQTSSTDRHRISTKHYDKERSANLPDYK